MSEIASIYTNDPELIRELWYYESALYREADGNDRRQADHMERMDALLDTYAKLGRPAVADVIQFPIERESGPLRLA